MSMAQQNKIIIALEQFLDSKSADILQLSHRLTNIPDEMQEGLWELVIAYIMATAEREKGWTPLMDVYVRQARDIVKNL